ncbi:conserved hypothetical protein [Arthrobacter sp. 9V]|uniref:DUF4062 domain-containing protein n=1 Tax=Arthrobacter sp. 9V TaxID=2653132 RepID=UPI0012F14D0D|nr:DUF4062 domain-containing protein [Arthrobacter sp. 9V]VXB51767.1 conserved hypothetical protein [Arthrobacter sp. 9V]
MSFAAHVLSVMIASPSDLPDARNAVQEAIYGWNEANARNKGVVLQPWRWETSAVPMVGGRAQALINTQGVDRSDIVFALFGSRLGSPTSEAASGTAEEIERAVELGKPVHVYFSNAPLPSDVDVEQLSALREFKKAMQDKSLLGEFNSASELTYEVWKAIEHDLVTLNLGEPSLHQRNKGVDFIVQPHSEREVAGYSSNGSPRYTTNHWLEVTNDGGKDAENVRFENANPESSMHLFSDDEPTIIHRGQARRVGAAFTMGGSGQPILRILWTEDGQERSREFHVG